VSLPLLTCSPSAWPSRLLYRRGRKSRKDLWITLYFLSHTLRLFPFFFLIYWPSRSLVTTFISDILTALFRFTDPRVTDWFLLGSPLYPLGLITLYLYVVKVAGPRYMKNRPAYQLSGIIALYNVIQIVLNAILFAKVSTGIYVRLRLKCDGKRADTRFRLSAKRTSLFKSTGGRQFSRLLAAEVCAKALVMLDTPCTEVVWRVLATHYIRQFPLHFPARASTFDVTIQLDSTPKHLSVIKSCLFNHSALLPKYTYFPHACKIFLCF